MALMPSRPPSATIAFAALAIFTVWITWKAKSLELSSRDSQSKPAMVGKQAPDFQLTTLDGRIVTLAEFRGKKKVVIDFWASWCGPCRIEMPVMRRFYQSTHKADAKFEFLAISTDEDRADAESAAKHDKLPFTVLMDSAGKTASAYQVEAIPTLLVIDEQGKVEWGETGFRTMTEIFLATALDIKDYKPQFGTESDAVTH
jgi:peroxiredoxin